MTRLQLKKVGFDTNPEINKCRASVQLSLGARDFTAYFETDCEQSPLSVIATATFMAIQSMLNIACQAKINFKLQVAEELQPLFLQRSLFIVIVEIETNAISVRATGAVMAKHEDNHRAVAAAALDATNRLVHHLLTLHECK
ncbi:MAG: hypothetical protein AB1489_29510 [Acidobacteriota bacterium]